METVKISGREYPARPRRGSSDGNRLRRLRQIAEALRFAAENCTELERRLYKSILEVRAHADNAVEAARGETMPEPSLSDLRKHELEP